VQQLAKYLQQIQQTPSCNILTR